MNEGDDQSDPVDALTKCQRHDLLANRFRQHVLAELAEGSAPIPLTELAEGVVVRTADRPNRDVRNVQIQLHHQHLPYLESHGLVEYDPSARTVRSNQVTPGVFDPEASR